MLILTLILIVNAYAGTINVDIDNINVYFWNETGMPFIDSNNRTQVPLRATMEDFGAKVDWDQENLIATIELDDTKVEVPIGESYILKNGEKILNDTVAQIKDNRTYLPIRAVLEAFGASVDWDNETQTVRVKRIGKTGEEKENRYFSEEYGDYGDGIVVSTRELYYQDGRLIATLYLYNGKTDKTLFNINNFKASIEDNDGNVIAKDNFGNLEDVEIAPGKCITKTFIFEKDKVHIQDYELTYLRYHVQVNMM